MEKKQPSEFSEAISELLKVIPFGEDQDVNLEEKKRKLRGYYKDKKFGMIGLNDLEEIRTTSTFFQESLLDYIGLEIGSRSKQAKIINAFSSIMNKTEHIDYLLEANLSVEQMKLMNLYSFISSLEKTMKEKHLPRVLGKIGYISKHIYTPKDGDNQIFLTDTIKEIEEPIIIYSSGSNNLMKELGNTPKKMFKAYKKRYKDPSYFSAKSQIENREVLDNVMDGIIRNFENILSINSQADIYVLGSYIPDVLLKQQIEIYYNLVLEYNERLEELCKQYQLDYVDTASITNDYVKGFHVNNEGQQILANEIINHIYERKINRQIASKPMNDEFEFHKNSISSFVNHLNEDYDTSRQRFLNSTGEEAKKFLMEAEDHARELDVSIKVMKKTMQKTKKD